MKRYNNLLLNTDGADGSAAEIDPLAVSAGAVDTKFPVLVGALYDMVIAEPKVGRNAADTGDVLVVKLKTTAEARDKNGDVVNPGFPVYHRIGLTPTPEYDVEKIKKNVASLAQAAGLTNVTIRDIINNPMQLDGIIVRCKVTVQPEKNGFPENNKIGGFVTVK